MIKGINSFNMDKNIRLATYVARCIENATFTCWKEVQIPMLLLYHLYSKKTNIKITPFRFHKFTQKGVTPLKYLVVNLAFFDIF